MRDYITPDMDIEVFDVQADIILTSSFSGGHGSASEPDWNDAF